MPQNKISPAYKIKGRHYCFVYCTDCTSVGEYRGRDCTVVVGSVCRLASSSYLQCWFLLPSPSDSCVELSVQRTRNQRFSSNSSYGFVLTWRTETAGEPWRLLKVVQRRTERHLLQLARVFLFGVAYMSTFVCCCTNHALRVRRHREVTGPTKHVFIFHWFAVTLCAAEK
jgi:hypothetical protein